MKLVDKDALVAEIERRVKLNDTCQKISGGNEFYRGAIDEAKEILSFINTLEVKEVNLEKHLKEDIEDVLFDLNEVAVKGATHYLTVEDVKEIAKHFFELGMQVSNKVQKGE